MSTELRLLAAFLVTLGVGCSGKSNTTPLPDAGVAVEACNRACTHLADSCSGKKAEDCEHDLCTDPKLPASCVSDLEVAGAWDQCAKSACGSDACSDQKYLTANAHCLGRADAGSGVYCATRSSTGSGNDCTLTASCEGKTYSMTCTAGTCTCTVDGGSAKTFTRLTSTCSAGEAAGSDWATRCGFPYE